MVHHNSLSEEASSHHIETDELVPRGYFVIHGLIRGALAATAAVAAAIEVNNSRHYQCKYE